MECERTARGALRRLLAAACFAGVAGTSFEIGVYGPITSISTEFLATAASFYYDVKKNTDAALVTRFGPALVAVPNFHADLDVKVQIGNSHSVPEQGMGTALSLMQGTDGRRAIHGLVGGYHSAISMPVANLATFLQVTQVSFGSTNAKLSNKDQYPYFLRTIPPDSIQGAGMWKFIKHFSVPMVTFLYAQEAYGEGLMQTVSDFASLASEGFRVTPIGVSYMPSNYDAEEARAKIKLALNGNSRIFFVAMTTDQGDGFWPVAAAEGMLSTSRQVVGSEALPLSRGMASLPVGYMWFSPQSQGPQFASFTEMWKKMTADDVTGATASSTFGLDLFVTKLADSSVPVPSDTMFTDGTDSMQLESPFIFDACYAFVLAANNLLNDGRSIADIVANRTLLLSAVKDVTFEGISGTVVFDANGDRLASYFIENAQDQSGSKVAVKAARYDAVSGSISIQAGESLYWMDGQASETIPPALVACKDGFYKDSNLLCQQCQTGLVSKPDQTGCEACPFGKVPVDNEETGERTCDFFPIEIGCYGPMTSVSMEFLTTAVMFDLDFRKNHDADLAARFGPPIVNIPDLDANLRIHLQIGNSHSDPAMGVGTNLEFFQGDGGRTAIVALIGGYHSAISMPVANLATQFKVTQVSFGSTNPGLSNKDAYPYFLRTIPPDSIQGAGMWTFIKQFDIPSVSFVFAQEPYAEGLYTVVSDAAVKAGEGYRINGVGITWMPTDYDQSEASTVVGRVRALDYKVVFVVMTSDQGNGFWSAAQTGGLLSGGYQIIGSEALPGTNWVNQLPEGYIWFSPLSRGTLFTGFDTMWKLMTAEDVVGDAAQSTYGLDLFKMPLANSTSALPATAGFVAGAAALSLEAPYLFDAGYTFVVAANNLMKNLVAPKDIRGKTLHTAVKAVTFEGISGQVQFNDDGDRLAAYEIRNLVAGATVSPAIFNSVTNTIDYQAQMSLHWVDGTSSQTPPKVYTNCKQGSFKDNGRCSRCTAGLVTNEDQTACVQCPAGRVAVDDLVTEVRYCDFYPIQLGVYGPITSVSVDFLLAAVAFDLDFRKNHDAALRTRLGPPVVAVQNLNDNLRIKIQIGTSDSNPDFGMATCMEFFQGLEGRTKIAGLIGGYHSAISMPVASVATQFKVPQVSFGSTNPGLSNKEAYPYFLRTIPPDSIQGMAMWAFIKDFQVPTVTMLYAQEPYGQGLFQAVSDLATKADEAFRITSVGIRWMPKEYDAVEATDRVRRVMDQASKLIIVIMTTDQGAGFWPVAKAEGLLESKYQIVGSEALPWTSFTDVLPAGYIWFSPQSQGALFPKFDELWKKMTIDDVTGATATSDYGLDLFKVKLADAPVERRPTAAMLSGGTGSIALEAPYLFDAGYSFVVAANSLINGGTAPPDVMGEPLLEAVKKVQFEGISGKVVFDPNGDRLASYFIMNAQPAGGRRLSTGTVAVVAAVFNAVDQRVETNDATPITWMAGTTSNSLPQVLSACEPGFKVNALRVCEKCPVGWFSLGGSATECDKCAKGTMANHPTAASSCETCPTGRYSGNDGLTECAACEPGTFAAEVGLTECTLCEVGSWQSATQSTSCTLCGGNRATAVQGSMEESACKCQKGFFRMNDASPCITCKEGMECPFGSDMANYDSWQASGRPSKNKPPFPVLEVSHMSLADNPLWVYKCDMEVRCPGGPPGTCGDNLKNSVRSCAHCVDGMYWDGEKCKKCSGFETSGALFPLLPLLMGPPLLCILYKVSRDDAEKWGSWRNAVATFGFLMLNHYQVTTLCSAANLQFSTGLVAFLSTYTFAIDPTSLFKPECAGYRSFAASIAVKSSTPLLVGLILILTHVGSHVVRRLTGKEVAFDINRSMNIYFSLMFTFFAGISAMALLLFKCTPNPNGDSTLATDQSVICYESDWSSLVIIAVLAVLIYIFGFGGIFLRTVIIAPRRFANIAFQRRWKFLFIKFRPDVWWWALVICTKGVMLNIGMTFFTLGIAQLYWVMGVVGVYSLAVAFFMPWRHRSANAVDIYMHFALMFLCSLLAFFVTTAATPETQALQNDIALAVIFINVSPLILAAYLLGMVIYKSNNPQSQAQQIKDVRKLTPGLLLFANASDQERHDFTQKLDEWSYHHLISALHVINTEFVGEGFKARLSDGKLKSSSSMGSNTSKDKDTPNLVAV